MISNVFDYIKLFMIFSPFILFQWLNQKANFKQNLRYKQFVMPIVAFVYFWVIFALTNVFYNITATFGQIVDSFLTDFAAFEYLNDLKSQLIGMGSTIALILLSTALLVAYVSIKKTVLAFFKDSFEPDTIKGKIAGLLYEYNEADTSWYLKKNFGQMRTFFKVAYYAVYALSVVSLFWSFDLCQKGLLDVPFCPAALIIVIGELAFYTDGLMKDEGKDSLVASADNSRHIAMYALLRKPLKKLFGDKLASEGTTINMLGGSGGSSEDVLASIEREGGHIGKNYAAFMRKKIDGGFAANVDYLRPGFDLAQGKSLLFNTPFYDKLIPYAFYAVNRTLLEGKNVLVVMGRHGTEEDLIAWCQKGMTAVTNVENLYNISVLSSGSSDEEAEVPNIGIMSRSGVHDLDIHKANMGFLKKVGFVIIVEPSMLVTTAQIGLNLLIKCCGENEKITFCSMDRNCDGLVDSLSHILMTELTEVSATEYPHGMSSFMCWNADGEYLQHRLFPGISRHLGLGAELSLVALKNQVKEAVWYGGDVYPVLDAHWISKQYYFDFLKYANLPTTQESFDQHFKTSFNMCNEGVKDYSYVTVEDDRNNLFEARRNFATIAEKQGFVNVISSEYMLRGYMSDNTEIFTADPKAIPYITADYARTKRNSVFTLCLLLCVGNVSEKDLKRQLTLMGVVSEDYAAALWAEICVLFSKSENTETDIEGNKVLVIETDNGTVKFEKASTLMFKREYVVDSGKFESFYTIEDKKFIELILADLQNAGYIAEVENQDYYIGTELKGHVYQKYLPGQFFTLKGKYYEMIATTVDNKIMVRRASEHISGRNFYRQVRNYVFNKLRKSEDMGALKTVNNIDIHYLYADFDVETSGYWKLTAHNDFKNGVLVEINAVPVRRYFNKQILKLDFSKFGEQFTESVKKTLTVLLNEVFVTLFAENQPFISAVTAGECEIPATYSLSVNDSEEAFDKSIYIVEDSQLDIGLLVAVERNINRILQIVSDYLQWNEEKIEESKKAPEKAQEPSEEAEAAEEVKEPETKKKNLLSRFADKVKSLFKKKDKKSAKAKNEEAAEETPAEEAAVEETTEETVVEETTEETIEETVVEETVEEALAEDDDTLQEEADIEDAEAEVTESE